MKKLVHGWPAGDFEKILIPAPALRRRVRALGRRISRDYQGQKLTVVCVLKGSLVFMADLLRAVHIPCDVDFMAVSSYTGTRSGAVRLALDLRANVAGQNVLLVEDIVDTGLTLSYLREILSARRVKSLKVCALLDKPSRHRAPVSVEYVGFRVPDRFVVGYGLDFHERYRNLPSIAVLKKSASK